MSYLDRDDGIFVHAGDKIHATRFATGPWNASHQHGGAPTALIVWAAERIETPAPMRVVRLTVDLMRPAPVGELSIETDILRQGRKIQLCQVRLIGDRGEVARATVLKIRQEDVSAQLETAILPTFATPPPDELPPHKWREISGGTPFNHNFDMRAAADIGDGKARVWFRQHRPLVAGDPISPAMRATAVADYANGVGTVLSWKTWTFVNGDLTVSFGRPPIGEWIMVEAEMWAAQDGIGMTSTRLADVHGYFGLSSQSLVLEPGGASADAPARSRA